jgi:hypothetical protein
MRARSRRSLKVVPLQAPSRAFTSWSSRTSGADSSAFGTTTRARGFVVTIPSSLAQP